MTRYPKYKPSGVNWIGDIPSHWDSIKIKHSLSALESGSRETGGGNILNGVFSIGGEHIGWFGELLLDNPKYIPEAYFLNLKNGKIKTRDLLLVKDGATIGKCAIVKALPFDKSAVNEHVFILRPNNDYVAEFIFYFIWCRIGREQILLNIRGSAQPGLNSSFVNEVMISKPPIAEQSAIADYLDKKTAQIDTLIARKQKLIDLLKEERTAIINHAVTKGVNPKAKLKPSGVEWIGNIPENWRVTRIKYISTVQGRIGFKGYKSSDIVGENEGALVLGAAHITRDHKIDIDEPVFLSWEKYRESPEIMVKQGDVVFTQRGVYLGKVALIDKDYGDITINPSLILLKENLINSGYLTFFLTTHYIRKTIDMISSSTAIPMISQENLSNFYCLVPTDKEQEEIIGFLNKENSQIDSTISTIEKQIELMQEYRAALISEVVTGKVKIYE